MPIGLGDLFGQAIPLDTSQLPSWLNEVLQIMLLQNPDYARIARTAITNLMSAPQTLMAASQYPTIPAAGQAVQQAGTGQTTTLPQPIMSGSMGGPSFASPAGQPATSPPPSVIHQVWGTMVDNGRAPASAPAGTSAPASSPTASPSPQATPSQDYGPRGGDMGGGGGGATGGGAGGGGGQQGGNPGNQGNIGGGGGGLVGENIGGGDYGSTWT